MSLHANDEPIVWDCEGCGRRCVGWNMAEAPKNRFCARCWALHQAPLTPTEIVEMANFHATETELEMTYRAGCSAAGARPAPHGGWPASAIAWMKAPDHKAW